MDSPLKQRLIGAAVLAALAIIFLPMLLKGPDVKEPDAAQVPLSMPNAPDQAFSTHELPLTVPDAHTPSGGVLGMETRPVPRPDVDVTPASASSSVTPPLDSDVAPVAVAPPATGSQVPGTVAPSAPLPATAPAVAANPAASAPAQIKPAPTTVVPAAPAQTGAAPAADAVPSTVKPSAVAAGNYSVNVGSFSNLGNAGALVTRLRNAGLPVSTEKVKLNGADALRIRVGPYADRAAAEAARLRAESMAGGSGKVVALDGDDKGAATVKPPVASKPATSPPAAAAQTPVPAPTPASAASKPAATVASGFAVQLAAPAEESAALALRDRARAAGFTAFVQRVDSVNGPRFRVRAGPVADHNAAETLRDAVKQKLSIDGNIVAHP